MPVPGVRRGPASGIRKVVDVAFFAPIGLAALARERLPDVIATGRERVEERVRVARAIGRIAVDQGRREIERRLTPPRRAPARRTPAALSPRPGSTRVTAPVVARDGQAGSARSAASLPIGDYESLAASQVVARLAALTADELHEIEAFEAANRNRRTVLGKISQLRAAAAPT